MTEIRADDYFAILPEWILHADISAGAVRLWAILNRYANSNGHAWPSRKTIAAVMRCSTATVDRAREELVEIGALTVIPRKTDAGDPTSNLYVLHTRPAGTSSPVTQGMVTHGGTGMGTSDDLNRTRVTHSHSGTSAPVNTLPNPSTWCETCHGRRIVIGPATTDADGYKIAPRPTPCPGCQL